MGNTFEQFDFSKEEDQNRFNELPQEEKDEHIGKEHEEALELNQLKNTSDFRDALDKEVPEAAGSFLKELKNNREKHLHYDDRWFDHREREVFKNYCQRGDWFAAKRIVESSLDVRSKEGRMKRLEELSGIKYEEIMEPGKGKR
jgi:hypothetical protein